MRLTGEKLIAIWRIRKQFFEDQANEFIVNRFNEIKGLFEVINSKELEFDSDNHCIIDGKEVTFKDGTKPSTTYFSCKDDDMTADEAYKGVKIMRKNFPEYGDLISKIGCLLGGFTFDENPIMKDEFRVISNRITGHDDNASLYSYGQIRHPSSHFADNNYFFNVISTIQNIRDDKFNPDESKLVLRWPSESYYSDDDKEAEKAQKETLKYRFPYKFFYMWTHTHNVIHPVSLLAYRNLVKQEDFKYEGDIAMSQDFEQFVAGWKDYSDSIVGIIPEDERGEDFYHELSMLISILMIQNQQIKDLQGLLNSGNQAIILYGPPGTGKTYSAKDLVCRELGISNNELDAYKFNESSIKEKGAWALVQFHPNYTYEDFIGGISPQIEGNTLSYTLKEGIFKKLCDKASSHPNQKFIIIIDEINRADLSSVFGELMYAIEYRNEEVSIPNFSEPFKIPSNIYIIGTMNSIDKSLVTFDLALRRRFAFMKIMPKMSVLETILADYNINETCMKQYIDRCKELNKNLVSQELQLGEDYQIGHAYFGKIKDLKKEPESGDNLQIISSFELEKLWDYHLQPLIEEYLGNRIEDERILDYIESLKEKFTEPLS